MNYTVENKNNIAIFKLENSTVENAISAEFKAQMLITAQPDIDALVIDLSMVEAIDSSGLGALLLANRQLQDSDIPVILVGVRDFVRSLMSMTKIDEVFLFFPTIEDAIAAINDGE